MNLSSVPECSKTTCHHFAEVFVEQRDHFGGIEPLGIRGEALEIGEKSNHFLALTPQGLEVRVRIVGDLLHNVLGDVAFQRRAHPAAFAALERDVTGDPRKPAEQPGKQRRSRRKKKGKEAQGRRTQQKPKDRSAHETRHEPFGTPRSEKSE